MIKVKVNMKKCDGKQIEINREFVCSCGKIYTFKRELPVQCTGCKSILPLIMPILNKSRKRILFNDQSASLLEINMQEHLETTQGGLTINNKLKERFNGCTRN